jgi:hypothetical protein
MNQARNRAFAALAGVFAVSLVGCGSGPYVPVSGVVTVNGKPYRNAYLQFQPMASAENPNPGRGSVGHTDENGHFTLKTDDGHEGAAVGKHRVRITTKYSKSFKGYEVWDPVQNKTVRSAADPIPPHWNYNSKQEFEVPAGGTDKANFEIVTRKQ